MFILFYLFICLFIFYLFIICLGMVSALDEAIGNVTAALKQNGMIDDTLIFFTADVGQSSILYSNHIVAKEGRKCFI